MEADILPNTLKRILVLLLLTACGPTAPTFSGEVPAWAIQTAIAETEQAQGFSFSESEDVSRAVLPEEALQTARSSMEETLWRWFDRFTFDPDNIVLDRWKQMPLTTVDELNQIAEIWCVGFTYIWHDTFEDLFVSGGAVFEVIRINDTWSLRESFDHATTTESGGGDSWYDTDWVFCSGEFP